ncbi:hypothetical protein [Shewanella sp.]|uniref:hypothetical protein n=1 Tax=Shewanella sp. TaxID=50422 RepID=UPI003A986756
MYETKSGKANVVIGSRTFSFAIHEEYIDKLRKSQNSLHDISGEMSSLLKDFLPRRELQCHLDIEGIKIPFDIPAYMVETFECDFEPSAINKMTEERFGEILRKSIPSSMTPPTERQLFFAKSIARGLRMDIPPEALDSVDSCSQFIDRYKYEFEEFKEDIKGIVKLARKAARGYILEKLVHLTEDEKLEVMGVSRPETLLEYKKGLFLFYVEFPSYIQKVKDILLENANEVISSYDLKIPPLTEDFWK